MDRLPRMLCPLLVILNTGATLNTPLETLLIAKNKTEISTIQSVRDHLNEQGVRLQLTTVILNTSKPFASVPQVYTNWPNIKLLLLSSSLCNPESSSLLLVGLFAPRICYMEARTEKIKQIIYMYSVTCLGKKSSVSSLIKCLEALKSMPSPDNLLGVLIGRLHWTITIVFFEDRMDSLATSISDELSRKSVQCLMYRLSSNQTDEDITNLISHVISLVPVSGRNFLLLCDSSTAMRILRKANEFSDRSTAMRMMSSWMVLLPMEEYQTFESTNLALDNVAAVLMSSAMFPYHTFASNSCTEAVVTTLLYKPTSRQWSAVGYLNTSGHIILQDAIFPNKDFGFNKRKLLVATILWVPFSMKRLDDNNETIYEGICMDLLQELATTFNFTYQVREPDDGEFGRVLNGSWTGVVGLLERQEVDMAVAPLTVTQEREVVMDFIYPYYYDAGAALYRLPDKSSSKWLTLMKPFKWEVFVCLGVVFLSMSLLLTGMEYNTIRGENKSTNALEVLSSCMWHILGSYFKHGSRKRLKSSPGRVLISFVWVFCIIVVAAYSGNLIAFLTVTKNYPPFRTLAEVAQQDVYTWGTDGGSMWTTLFQTSNRSDYQMIWKGILSHNKTEPGVLSLVPDLHRSFVEEGSYLFFFDRDVIAVWAQDNCDLVLLEETFYQITYAVGLPQNSPYGSMLSEKMLKIEQSGLLQIWKGNWWPKGSACAGRMQVQATVIELIDLQSAFYVLGIGGGTAMLVLLTERLRRCFQTITRGETDESNR